MRVAAVWSLNPSVLQEDFREPSLGLLGELPR
jgi:hypothetical protein